MSLIVTWVCDDGGRSAAGYRGQAGDCVTRAIAIATQQPYKAVYDAMAAGNAAQRRTRREVRLGRRKTRSAAYGISTGRKWFKDYMAALGWRWTPTMGIGTGCTVHLDAAELPGGRLIVAVSNHYTAVINGVVHDTHDPTRDGTRCVYGYWSRG